MSMFRPDKQMAVWLAGKALKGESLGLTAKRLLGKQMRAEIKAAASAGTERRLTTNGDRVVYMEPPPIIVFCCEFLIEAETRIL